MPDVSEFMEQRQPVTAPHPINTRQLILLILETVGDQLTATQIRGLLKERNVTPTVTDTKRHLASLCRCGHVGKRYDETINKWFYWKK